MTRFAFGSRNRFGFVKFKNHDVSVVPFDIQIGTKLGLAVLGIQLEQNMRVVQLGKLTICQAFFKASTIGASVRIKNVQEDRLS